jgi:HEPN domain-containing protein
MNRQGIINYWQVSAMKDYETMRHLFDSQDYHWSLFMGHLVIEKLLKALYVKNINLNPPKTHDLSKLAEQCGLELSESDEDKLDTLTTFHIKTRYPDYQMSFYETCDQEFANQSLSTIEEMKVWLMQQI